MVTGADQHTPNDSIERFKAAMAERRGGNCNLLNNGYHLWLYAVTALEDGATWEELDATHEEVEETLIQYLNDVIENALVVTSDIGPVLLNLVFIEVYFLDQEDTDEFFGIFTKLDISVEDFEELVRDLDIRMKKEELVRCRTEGPSGSFWELRGELLRGDISYEELETTREEIEGFTTQYLGQHPRAD